MSDGRRTDEGGGQGLVGPPMKEAMYWEPADDDRVRCLLCPHGCVIAEGKRGICTTRMNVGGRLYTLTWGLVLSGHVDPIEKKPLYHFAPGSGVYSFGTLGCTMKCAHCQNHTLSMTAPPVPGEGGGMSGGGGPSGVRSAVDRLRGVFSRNAGGGTPVSPDRAVEDALASGAAGIAWTYNEPTVWFEYMLETSKLARQKGLYVVTVTNGFINPEPFARLAPFLDATNIDLKSFEDTFYRKRCKARLAPVLGNAVQARKAGVHVELTTLVIPTRNDDPELIAKEAGWVVDNLGPDTPVHLSRFRPEYMDTSLPPTPPETMLRCAATAREAGLLHVYIGNMHSEDYSDTRCPSCGKVVVGRSGFSGDVAPESRDGRCGGCKEPVFKARREERK